MWQITINEQSTDDGQSSDDEILNTKNWVVFKKTDLHLIQNKIDSPLSKN